ncbi:hypothetical protein BpHYR1_013234 [Brachionus plicatilis]|uniref:Uncharacterized protein n=1 Tax=Brachionus plicatilis TaxID=10195 RepID=A0A3M7RSD2_BRAPC|nr:hypothetical protein BpHYR1_013234 [Brachionus plicatilis]
MVETIIVKSNQLCFDKKIIEISKRFREILNNVFQVSDDNSQYLKENLPFCSFINLEKKA